MSNDDRFIKNFMAAGSDLLQHRLAQLDPTAADGLARMLRSGAVLSLTCQVGPATGMARMEVSALPITGEPLQICAVELQRVGPVQ